MRIINLLYLCVLCFISSLHANKNTILFRSFSSYISRALNLELPIFLHNNNVKKTIKSNESLISYDQSNNIVVMSGLAFEYMQNFGKSTATLGAIPFWSGNNILTIGNNDGKANFDAYQLGLGNIKKDSDGNTILGAISLDPIIRQIGGDIMLYLGRPRDQTGWFCRLNIPLGAMIITPQFKELSPVLLDRELGFTQITDDPASSSITYYFEKYPTLQDRYDSIIKAFLGGSSNYEILEGNLNDVIRLRKGRMINGRQEFIRISDITFCLGYNLFVSDANVVGLSLKVSCPTGNVPTADYVIEPIFGRSGLWGLGGEINFYHQFKQQSENRYIDIFCRAELLHLLIGRSYNYRSFDLKLNGPGSRYMLVQYYIKAYATSGSNIIEVRNASTLHPAINLTTLPVHSEIAVEGSCACLYTIHRNSWNFGLGVEFWGRSQEKLSIDNAGAVDLRLQSLNDYAVVGRQLSRYHIDGQTTAVETYYCEPLATISKSQDAVKLVGSVTSVTAPGSLPTGIKDARLAENRIPEKLEDALDIAGAQADASLSAKLSCSIQYEFSNYKHKPTIGLMIGIELEALDKKDFFSIWSLGFKGSLLF